LSQLRPVGKGGNYYVRK